MGSYYILEEIKPNRFNAIAKAREDANSIAKEEGFVSIYRYDTRGKECILEKIILFGKSLLELIKRLKKDDVLLVQCSLKILKQVIGIKKIKKFKLIYLLMDLFEIRYDVYSYHEREIVYAISMINECEYVITHNVKMSYKLKKFGCRSNVFEIGIFDYILANDRETINHSMNPLCFTYAGDIRKSPFLETLANKLKNSKLILYGKYNPGFERIIYKGAVESDELPFEMEGSFGLIWDGTYEVVKEDYYTRYNCPHKLSLYIISGMPVITWSGSGIAEYVQNNNIGIVIDSLDVIENKVKSIPEDEYNTMISNCMNIRKDIVNGSHLRKVLLEIRKDIDEE